MFIYVYRQVEGKDGLPKLFAKFRTNGISTFFQGSLASATATFVGHYPWFFVYNYMSEHLPKTDDFAMKLGILISMIDVS
jgi:hypothetical protein